MTFLLCTLFLLYGVFLIHFFFLPIKKKRKERRGWYKNSFQKDICGATNIFCPILKSPLDCEDERVVLQF